MAAKKTFDLKVITPGGVKLEEPAEMAIMRTTTGDLGVLPGHQPLSAALEHGIMRVTLKGGESRYLGIFGGLAKVDESSLTVFTGIARLPGEVDLAEATAERDQCLERLKEKRAPAGTQQDKDLLKQALVRIELSGYRAEAEG